MLNLPLAGNSGTGTFAGTTSASFTTPTLGAATATSINFGGSSLANYVAATNWTPVFTFTTIGDLSVSYATQVGRYMRIGDTVYAGFNLTFTPTFTTSAGTASITGLPITSATSSLTFRGEADVSSLTFPASVTGVTLLVTATSTVIGIQGYGSGIATANFAPAAFTTGVACTINGFVTYFA